MQQRWASTQIDMHRPFRYYSNYKPENQAALWLSTMWDSQKTMQFAIISLIYSAQMHSLSSFNCLLRYSLDVFLFSFAHHSTPMEDLLTYSKYEQVICIGKTKQ